VFHVSGAASPLKKHEAVRLFFTSSPRPSEALLVKSLPPVACEDVRYCDLCLALLALRAVLFRLNPLRSLVKFARSARKDCFAILLRGFAA